MVKLDHEPLSTDRPIKSRAFLSEASMLHLPAIVLPSEFVALLKSNNAGHASALRTNLVNSPGLGMVLERAFSEFDEHHIGLEKVMDLLGWAHFRDRMASVYVFKTLHGSFPAKTDMQLVEDIVQLESRFSERAPSGDSRLFLLGLYLKLVNLSRLSDAPEQSITIPASVEKVLLLSQVRTERLDWLLLLCWHLGEFLGTQELIQAINAHTPWPALYARLSDEQRFQLVSNLLSYGASIQEEDPFLYERI